jgi:hypothetical protein
MNGLSRTRSPRLPGLAAALLLIVVAASGVPAGQRHAGFEPVRSPGWVAGVTRMAFMAPGPLDAAAKAGVQVIHTNIVWPYYPLRRDGGGLSKPDAERLRSFTLDCHRRGMKLILGLPPFPPVELVKAHPDWRVHPDDTGGVLKVAPDEKNLGTRLGCNLGPWGDYLIEVCAELVQDYGLDGFSFDGNYHPRICYCPSCKQAYQRDTGRAVPARVDLDDVDYRRYLTWRGEQLEDHYRRMQERLKAVNREAVLMSWTVNAGRYGHFLHSPRAMPARLNLLFDLPMQEWWLDETNFGGSVVPAFGAAYLRAAAGDRPNASEAYLMSRGNPYGTNSFPRHERVARILLAMTHGSVTAESFGWPGHAESTVDVFREAGRRDRWITHTRRMPWAAMLVSEQTRQFYAYRDIAERYLPHLFGAFRTAMEEHLALNLINDWDLTPETLSRHRVLLLPNAAALSDAQVAAVRAYVRDGGGLVATCETSLCDELGRPRRDFALADLFGISYRGRPKASQARPELDPNFAIAIDERYWRERVGVATVRWGDHPLLRDARLEELVPQRSVIFRGPQVMVSEPGDASEAVIRMTPDGWTGGPLPALVSRRYGRGRVVYMAAGFDAAMWSYSFPYQRRLLARALNCASQERFPISVRAPMCVQCAFYEQADAGGRRIVIHLFNGIDTTGGHGLPAMDVPLREETVPIHGIGVRFEGIAPTRFHVEPGGVVPRVRHEGTATVVDLPPLALHAMLVAER